MVLLLDRQVSRGTKSRHLSRANDCAHPEGAQSRRNVRFLESRRNENCQWQR